MKQVQPRMTPQEYSVKTKKKGGEWKVDRFTRHPSVFQARNSGRLLPLDRPDK